MSAPEGERVPLEPLIAAVGLDGLLAHVDSGAVSRARRRGLSEVQADRWAVRCGLHPFEVWPELVDAAIADAEAVCGHCGDRFMPVAVNHRFCSTPCRKEAHRRTLAGAGANRARRRRGYAGNAAYERARERDRYAARKQAAVIGQREGEQEHG